MKKTRKLISLLMALAMIFALSIPAFATGETITVTNANVGETYEAYLVFTATTNGTSNTYYITSSSPYFDYIDPSKASNSPFTLVATGADGTYQVTFTDGDAAAAYIVSIGAKGSAVATVTANSETAVLNVNQAGYYFVTTTTGTAVSTSPTTGNADITDKNSEPTVEKTETTDGTAGIGSKVEYKAVITAAEDATTLVYHDTMSSGLTFNNDVVIEGMTKDINYTVVTEGLTDGCTFEVKFTSEGLAKITDEAQQVVITYSATVNANAVTMNELTNEATLSYGEAGKSQSSSTSTKVYGFDLNKTTSDGNALNGASFTLTDSEGIAINFVKVDGGYRVATSNEINDEPDGVTTTIKAGSVNIDGLDAGTYTLTETAAPAGYNMLTSAITVTIAQDGTVSISGNGNGSIAETTGAVTVVNYSGSTLPSTGGMGTTLFYIFGGAMVLCAVVLLVTRRRMDNEQ